MTGSLAWRYLYEVHPYGVVGTIFIGLLVHIQLITQSYWNIGKTEICVHLEAYRQKYVFIWKPILNNILVILDAITYIDYFPVVVCFQFVWFMDGQMVFHVALPVCWFMDGQMVSRLANLLSSISLLNRQMLIFASTI